MAVCEININVKVPLHVKIIMFAAPLLRLVLNDSVRNKVADYCINQIKLEVE